MSTTNRIAPLDGLRTFAAFGVIWIHSWTYSNNPSLQVWHIDLARVIAILGNGVDFFFVISGFFMYMVLNKIELSGASYLGFIKKRWFRIAPAFYVSAIVYAAFFFIQDAHYRLIYNLFINFTFSGNLVANGNIVGPFWSLGTEWHFYLLIPFLFWKGSGVSFLKRLAVLSGISIIFFLLVSARVLDEGFWKPQVITRFIEFGWGSLAAYGYKRQLSLPVWMRGYRGGIVFSLAVMYTGRIFMTTEIVQWLPRLGWILRGFAEPVMTAGFAWLMYIVITENNPLSRFLSLPPLSYLGRISYSVYLWHSLPMILLERFPVRTLYHNVANPVWVFAVVSAATVIIAHFSYKFLEEPYFKGKRHGQVSYSKLPSYPV
jgi:peptidoglycan/LPS O-acetylase OafA/YrhL